MRGNVNFYRRDGEPPWRAGDKGSRRLAWEMHPPIFFGLAKENGPCTVISALRAAALRRLRSETLRCGSMKRNTLFVQTCIPCAMGRKFGDAKAVGGDRIELGKSHPAALDVGNCLAFKPHLSRGCGSAEYQRKGFRTPPVCSASLHTAWAVIPRCAMRRGGVGPPCGFWHFRGLPKAEKGAAAEVGAEAHAGFARFCTAPVRVAERGRRLPCILPAPNAETCKFPQTYLSKSASPNLRPMAHGMQVWTKSVFLFMEPQRSVSERNRRKAAALSAEMTVHGPFSFRRNRKENGGNR